MGNGFDTIIAFAPPIEISCASLPRFIHWLQEAAGQIARTVNNTLRHKCLLIEAVENQMAVVRRFSPPRPDTCQFPPACVARASESGVFGQCLQSGLYGITYPSATWEPAFSRYQSTCLSKSAQKTSARRTTRIMRLLVPGRGSEVDQNLPQ